MRWRALILGDGDIVRLIRSGDLVIEPFDPEIVRENGLDLRLGRGYCRFKPTNRVFDPREPGDPGDYYECGEAGEIIVPPREHMLLHTLEYIKLPPDIAGLVNLRSTWARTGIYIPACLSPDTWVIDSSGAPVPAGEAERVVDPFTGGFSKPRARYEYDGPMVEVYIDDVPEVVTPNHKYLVFDPDSTPPFVERPASMLRPGDLVAVYRGSLELGSDTMLLPPDRVHARLGPEASGMVHEVMNERRVSYSIAARILDVRPSRARRVVEGRSVVRWGNLRHLLDTLDLRYDDILDDVYLGLGKARLRASNLHRSTVDIAQLIGYYTGDGVSLSSSHVPIITDRDEERLHWYGETYGQLLGVSWRSGQIGGRGRLVFNSTILSEWLRVNFGEAVAVRQPHRHVPRMIGSSGSDAVFRFLAGLFDAEGSSSIREDIVVTTTSRGLAVGVKLLLLRLDVYASIDVKRCLRCKNGIIYSVRVNGAGDRESLRRLLRGPRKRLSSIIEYGKENVDLIPLSAAASAVLRRIKPQTGDDRTAVRNLVGNYVRRGRIPYPRIPLVLDLLRRYQPQGWLDAYMEIVEASRFRWVKVKRVEVVGNKYGYVVDWETGSHWHVTQATITHNTVVDAGFEGQLTIEVIGSSFPVKLYPGDRFLHLVLVKLQTPAKRPYQGQYKGQTGVRLPKFFG